MPQAKKARAVGFNHVALEVGDIEEALAFYGRLFDFELRGKSATSAFIDLGDQFLALQKGRKQSPDDGRHFGLVVAGVQSVGSSPPEGIVLVFSSLDRALGRPPRRAFRQIGTFATPVSGI